MVSEYTYWPTVFLTELCGAAVHYTHATATFTASFVLRLARLLYVLLALILLSCSDICTVRISAT